MLDATIIRPNDQFTRRVGGGFIACRFDGGIFFGMRSQASDALLTHAPLGAVGDHFETCRLSAQDIPESENGVDKMEKPPC